MENVLTKRELIAAMLLQGMYSKGEGVFCRHEMIVESVRGATDLLNHLVVIDRDNKKKGGLMKKATVKKPSKPAVKKPKC